MEIRNKLSRKEKELIPIIGRHDGQSPLIALSTSIETVDRKLEEFSDLRVRMHSLTNHGCYCFGAIGNLSMENILVTEHSYVELETLMDNLSQVLGTDKVRTDIQHSQDIPGNEYALYVVLYTLAKNGLHYGGNVKIGTREHSGLPEATYVPRGAKKFERFLETYVQDEGNGFPDGFDLRKTLKKVPRKDQVKESGFGLTLTGIYSRAFMAPINVNSVQGKNRISVYHPDYRSVRK